MIDQVLARMEECKKRFSSTDSFRVFHGRGACYEGLDWLCIDFFSPALLLTVYREPESQVYATLLVELKGRMENWGISALLVQRRDLKRYTLDCIAGKSLPNKLFAQRGSLRFILSSTQQNVGFFLDIEPARKWLEQSVANKTVLNLFAFTCTFSVIAVAAGARSVVNIDMSRSALNVGRENHRLNSLATDRVKFFDHDILRSWGKLKRLGPFDIVIVDPPSYQKGSFVATKDYIKVLRKLPELVHEGGMALLCLNAPEISCEDFRHLVEGENLPLVFLRSLDTNRDFPEKGEGGISMLVYRVESGVLLPCW